MRTRPSGATLCFLTWAGVVAVAWGLQAVFGHTHWPGSSPATMLSALQPTGDPGMPGISGFARLAALQPLGLARLLLPDLLAVSAFVAANLALGDLLLFRWRGDLNAAERLVLGFGIGSLPIGLALMGLALLGAFRPPLVHGLLIAALVVGVAGGLLLRRGRLARPRLDGGGPPLGACLAAAGMALVGLLVLARCYLPDLDLDSVQFHRVAINQLIRTGQLDICYENYAANRPLQLELFQALAFEDRPLSAMIQASFTLMAGLAVAAALWRRTGATVAMVGCLLYLLNHSVMWRAGLHANENCLAFYILVGLIALARDLEAGRRVWLLLGAALLGFSVGTYYLGLLAVTAGLAALLLMELSGHRGQRRWLWYALVSALALSPWLLRNELQLGNPVYPLLYHWFGGAGLSATAEHLHTAIAQSILFIPRSLVNLVAVPFGWPVRELFDPILLLFWPLALPRSGPRARLLAAWLLGFYLLWFALMPQDRFLIPALPVLAVLAGLGLHRVLGSLEGRWRAGALAGLAVLLACTLFFRAVEFGGPACAPLAQASRAGPQDPPPGIWADPLVRTVNQELPPGARIAGISNGFLDKPAYTILPVGFFDLAQMQDAEGLLRVLADWEITHLVIPQRGTPDWDAWVSAGFEDPVHQGFIQALDATIPAHCSQLHHHGRYQLCALQP